MHLKIGKNTKFTYFDNSKSIRKYACRKNLKGKNIWSFVGFLPENSNLYSSKFEHRSKNLSMRDQLYFIYRRCNYQCLIVIWGLTFVWRVSVQPNLKSFARIAMKIAELMATDSVTKRLVTSPWQTLTEGCIQYIFGKWHLI